MATNRSSKKPLSASVVRQPEKGPREKREKKPRLIGRGQKEALKFAAETLFVFTLTPLSLADLSAKPEFADIAIEVIRKWAREDKWVEKRRDFLLTVRRKMEMHITEGMVQQNMETLKHYDDIRKNLAAFLVPNDDGQLRCQPKSLESGISALIKLDSARAEIRKEVMGKLGDRIEQSQAPEANLPELSEDQARKLAHAVMAAELAKEDADSGGTPPA